MKTGNSLSIVALALGLGLLATAVRAVDEVNRADPKSTAAAILKAYKAKDLKAMMDLSTALNKKILAELQEKGGAHPQYKAVFGGYRWEAVSKWDGKTLDEPRYNKDRCWVKFADGADKRIVVMSMKSEDEGKTWAFNAVISLDPATLEKESKTPTKAGDVDRTDPKSTAAAILRAYKAKDYKAMGELATTTNKKICAELAEKGEADPRYESLFGGFRWKAVANWDGKTLEEPRYAKDRAWVKFADGSENRPLVVSLKLEEGKWAFDDLEHKHDLEKQSRTPTKEGK